MADAGCSSTAQATTQPTAYFDDGDAGDGGARGGSNGTGPMAQAWPFSTLTMQDTGDALTSFEVQDLLEQTRWGGWGRGLVGGPGGEGGGVGVLAGGGHVRCSGAGPAGADQVGRVGAWACWRAGCMSAVQVQDLLGQTRWGVGSGRGVLGLEGLLGEGVG